MNALWSLPKHLGGGVGVAGSPRCSFLQVVALGQKNRAVSATAMNAESSRSHSILTIIVERTDRLPEGQDDGAFWEKGCALYCTKPRGAKRLSCYMRVVCLLSLFCYVL